MLQQFAHHILIIKNPVNSDITTAGFEHLSQKSQFQNNLK